LDPCEEDVGGSVLCLGACHCEDGGEPPRAERSEALVFAESGETAGPWSGAVVERTGDVGLPPRFAAVA
jgi:hypothetical protein